MASLSNSRGKNGKECSNLSTNNGDIVGKDKRDVVDESVNHKEADLLKITSFGVSVYIHY